MKRLLFSLIAVLVITGCCKDDRREYGPKRSTNPSITLISPMNGGLTFTVGGEMEVVWKWTNLPEDAVITVQLTNIRNGKGLYMEPVDEEKCNDIPITNCVKNTGHGHFKIPCSCTGFYDTTGYGNYFCITIRVFCKTSGQWTSGSWFVESGSCAPFAIVPH